MNYWKKMAFVLALVAGLCGGAWAADWGHRDASHAQNNHTWRGSVPQHSGASLPNRAWSSHTTPNYQYRTGGWGTYRNNPNYQYRNGQWVYVPNRSWGTYYPNGTYGSYYPYPTTGGYYPYPTTGGYYPYPTSGGYYPGGYGYGGPGTYGYGGNDYQLGYRDGVAVGRGDRARGRSYRVAQYQAYKRGDNAYRDGWAKGYNAGYYGRGSYGRVW
jgi:hypothetical protein